MIKGIINPDGSVQLMIGEWDHLRAPADIDPKDFIYLPCGMCRSVMTVPNTIGACLCQRCAWAQRHGTTHEAMAAVVRYEDGTYSSAYPYADDDPEYEIVSWHQWATDAADKAVSLNATVAKESDNGKTETA